MTPTAIALNRFGLGARPDEAPPTDPRRWLLDQFGRYVPLPPAWAELPKTDTQMAGYIEQQRQVRDAPDADKQALRQVQRREARGDYLAAVTARAGSALTAPAPFVERLVHFWANHFAVSVEKPALANLAGAFEAEAIRPHVLGRFEDMLLAVERHPAMLVYLDQVNSIGPNSLAAERAARNNPGRVRGLNENLAREIMELHTLGVRSGYSQADVTEFARAMTGWSVAGLGAGRAGPGDMAIGGFTFRPVLHEPGDRSVMGRTYAQPGEGQAMAVLHDLATAPATAQHVANKLARHFVADTPPPALVERLAARFMRSGGSLPEVYQALVEAPESWTAAPAKFKTPWEWGVSALRGVGRSDLRGLQFAPLMTQLGQPVWRPGSPAGYDDIAASWAAPDALVRRVELAQRFAAQAGSTIDARALGPQLLPGSLSEATATAIARAESGPTALALLFVSPDFLRR